MNQKSILINNKIFDIDFLRYTFLFEKRSTKWANYYFLIIIIQCTLQHYTKFVLKTIRKKESSSISEVL